ncbi:hypothetical protein L7F22_017549 [Adiantum nelumboides]|nr:hypothetical protein [Adiantum nelumboides]
MHRMAEDAGVVTEYGTHFLALGSAHGLLIYNGLPRWPGSDALTCWNPKGGRVRYTTILLDGITCIDSGHQNFTISGHPLALATDHAYLRFTLMGGGKTLQKSQERQKKAADSHRRDLKLKENDWVLLRFEKALLRKKRERRGFIQSLVCDTMALFQITERINDVSFRLRLPDTWKIHNAFHVSLLKPFRGDVPDDGEPDEQPEVEENEEILVPEQILAHKDTKTKGKVRRRFLVKFKNYPTLDAKWMEEDDLADTPQIVKLYLKLLD